MRVVLYLSDKDREFKIGQALIEGFKIHEDEVTIIPTNEFDEPLPDAQLAVTVGVKGQSRNISDKYRRTGRHVLLVDKSYFGRGDYYRLSLDGFQPHYAHKKPRPDDRLQVHGIQLKPLRIAGDHVIYAGSSQKYCNWHDLGDATTFAKNAIREIRNANANKLPVYYRPKPSWVAGHPNEAVAIADTIFSGPGEFLADRLANCHALVTHGSNAALEAICAGVPVVLISKRRESAAWPLCSVGISESLADPRWPTDEERRQVCADLAYCQFTLDEMASGFAWETLLPHTIKALPKNATTVDQYRIMHENPKAFRGGSLKGHVEAVLELVNRFKPASLLDYGSGKGRQYSELRLHDRWGGLEPVCYDPGYPPLAEKPTKKFDGVICTDVAEHIAEPDIPGFLADSIGYAQQFAFFCVFTGPARKLLPDGRNCHLTQRPQEWWLDQFCKATGGAVVRKFSVKKVVPGGFADFEHFAVQKEGGPEVVVTFRGVE